MYAKIFAQMFDGTLCTKGPWQALVTFQQLLILADPEGNVDMTPAAISRRTTIPLEIIEAGLPVLLEPDPESRTPAEDGRRLTALADGRGWGWHIVNYAHYRELKREEDRRAYHRNYWHKRKLNNSTETQHTQPNQPKKETIDKRQETLRAEDGFGAFWGSYPSKKAKQAALKAWEKLKPSVELQGVILKAIGVQSLGEDWQKDGGRFVPYAATWLNGQRWADESPKLAVVRDI